MSGPETSRLPGKGQLLRATFLAAVVAAVLLVSVIAPAEYGVDPLGIGRRLGLLRSASAISSEAIDPVAAATVSAQPSPFRTDEMSVTLAWGESAEIKAEMQRGQHLVFGWTSKGGAVNVDMHGERPGETEATSYAKGEDTSG